MVVGPAESNSHCRLDRGPQRGAWSRTSVKLGRVCLALRSPPSSLSNVQFCSHCAHLENEGCIPTVSESSGLRTMGVYSLLALHVDVCRQGNPAALRKVAPCLSICGSSCSAPVLLSVCPHHSLFTWIRAIAKPSNSRFVLSCHSCRDGCPREVTSELLSTDSWGRT